MTIGEPLKSPDQSDSSKVQQSIRGVLIVLAASSIAGVASLVANVAYVSSRSGSSGTTTNVVHHTSASRVWLSAICIFQVMLVVGILRRRRWAWRAGFALPLLWASIIAVVGWPQIAATSTGWISAIPMIFLAGIAVWKTVDWRRQWGHFEREFK